MKPVALALLLGLSAGPALALNVCTDADGKISYQQQACEGRSPQLVNQPLKAQALNPRLAKVVVDRFAQAVSARDAQATQQHLASSFVVVVHTEKGDRRMSRAQFTQMVRTVLNAASSYQYRMENCGAATPEGDKLNMECTSVEDLELIKRKGGGRAEQKIQIGLEDGFVKIFRMESRQLP